MPRADNWSSNALEDILHPTIDARQTAGSASDMLACNELDATDIRRGYVNPHSLRFCLIFLSPGMFEGAARRPVIVWAIIGTTTCVSRSVQIWVTSNLWWERDDQPHTNSNAPSPKSATSHSHSQAHHYQHHAHNRPRGSVTSLLQNSFPSLPNFPSPAGVGVGSGVGVGGARANGRGGYWKRWRGGKWGGRRWDWREVGVKCVLPAGIVYVVMAWAEALRREWRGC